MIVVRKSEERGKFDHGWLKTSHTFSFADYHDPNHMGFRSLRVINEDEVLPGQGFGTHGHRDMEIITYVIQGSLEHKDSMGNGSIIRPNEIQYMSAGSGVRHSEFNHHDKEPVHLLQIWIMPKVRGAEPRYDQRGHTTRDKTNNLLLLASGNENDSAIHIRQDAKVYACILEPGKTLEFSSDPRHGQWLQIVFGKMDVNSTVLESGDGAAIESEHHIKFTANERTEFLLFDLNDMY